MKLKDGISLQDLWCAFLHLDMISGRLPREAQLRNREQREILFNELNKRIEDMWVKE